MTNKATYKNIDIFWIYKGVNYTPSFKAKTYDYVITLKNKDTKKFTRFLYHEGLGNKKGAIDWKSVLDCIFSDMCAYTGTIDFYDFCADFGYDVYEKNSQNIYKACKSTFNKLSRIGIDTDFCNEFTDFLNDYYN